MEARFKIMIAALILTSMIGGVATSSAHAYWKIKIGKDIVKKMMLEGKDIVRATKKVWPVLRDGILVNELIDTGKEVFEEAANMVSEALDDAVKNKAQPERIPGSGPIFRLGEDFDHWNPLSPPPLLGEDLHREMMKLDVYLQMMERRNLELLDIRLRQLAGP